ncbi:hypothetical protein B0H16DRAFT_1349692, partial [Mycena metata]
GSATTSERVCSNTSLTATQRRNRVSPRMFEALQIVKSAYCNNHIGAAEDPTKCMISDLDELEWDDQHVTV